MSQTTHHGDPNRQHNFWVYPKHRNLIDTRWDAYDPHDLCNDFTFLGADPSGAGRYKCNGHQK
jgi:hypothetical protein